MDTNAKTIGSLMNSLGIVSRCSKRVLSGLATFEPESIVNVCYNKSNKLVSSNKKHASAYFDAGNKFTAVDFAKLSNALKEVIAITNKIDSIGSDLTKAVGATARPKAGSRLSQSNQRLALNLRKQLKSDEDKDGFIDDVIETELDELAPIGDEGAPAENVDVPNIPPTDLDMLLDAFKEFYMQQYSEGNIAAKKTVARRNRIAANTTAREKMIARAKERIAAQKRMQSRIQRRRA